MNPLILFFGVLSFIASGIATAFSSQPSALPRTAPPFILYNRRVLWLQQIAFTITLTFFLIHITREGSTIPFSYGIMHLLVVASIMQALYADGIQNISLRMQKRLWIAHNVSVVLYFSVSFVDSPNTLTLGALVCCVVGCASGIFCYLTPRSTMQLNEPTVEYTSGILTYLSFSYLNELIIKKAREKNSLDASDVPTLSDEDSAEHLWTKFKPFLKAAHGKDIKLFFLIFRLIRREWFHQGFFQLLSSVVQILSPLALQNILFYVGNVDSNNTESTQRPVISLDITTAVIFLFLGPALKSIGDNQNYQRGRHIGIRVKAALIGAIYQKALTVDLTCCKEGIGKLNNFISVDVGDIQSLSAYSHYFWSTILDMIITSSLLFTVLGVSALGGLAILMLSMAIGFGLGKRMEFFQGEMLKKKDARISIMSEVLNGIRIIKCFAWEDRNLNKISGARRVELSSLRSYSTYNALLFTLWEIVPALVSAFSFIIHSYALGRELTPSKGFTALVLFDLIRFPLAVLPDMFNLLIRAQISMKRIETFLKSDDVKGLGRIQYPSTMNSSPRISMSIRILRDRSSSVGSSNASTVDTGGEVRMENITAGWMPVVKESDVDNELEELGGDDGPEVAGEFGTSPGIFDGACSWICTRLCCQASGTRISMLRRSNSYAQLVVKDGLKDSELSRSLSPRAEVGSPPRSSSVKNLEQGQGFVLGQAETKHGGQGLGFSSLWGSSLGLRLGFGGTSTNSVDSRSTDMDSSRRGLISADFEDKSKTLQMAPLSLSVPSKKQIDPSSPPRARADDFCIEDHDDVTSNGGFVGTVILNNVTLTIPPGSLVVICGLTGSGKSTMLSTLLGECRVLSGNSSMIGSLSYVSQSAWIQNGTVRDNVVFGSEFDEDKYKAALAACSLDLDLKILPLGDMTEIGERGVNLSGGQQQRVSLARAAYNRSNVVILDDPLSAVDAHVGESIFNELICKFLKPRTRILVTHQIAMAVPAADLVAVVDYNGMVVTCCRPDELQINLEKFCQCLPSSPSPRIITPELSFAQFCRTLIQAAIQAADATAGLPLERLPSPRITNNVEGGYGNERLGLDLAAKTNEASSGIEGSSSEMFASDIHSSSDGAEVNSSGENRGIVSVETKAAGEVSLRVYEYYFKACGGYLVAVVLLGTSVWVSASWVLQGYALGRWMEAMESGDNHSQNYLWRYLLCGASILISTLLRACAQLFASLAASQKLHDAMTVAVLLAPMSWFDATPVGRIVNRFSQDIAAVDSDAMGHIIEFVDCLLGTFQIFAVIAVFMPLLFVVFVPIILFTAWTTYQYLKVSRELKRLESVHKSPVFVLFSETLHGLSTIRAFRQEERFFGTCCQRVDMMNRCHLYLWLCNRWLNFRMQCLGALVAGLVGLFVVAEARSLGSTAAGLALVYSLTFTDRLTFLARSHAEVQINLNSVERIQEFTEIKSEQYIPLPSPASQSPSSALLRDGSAVAPEASLVPQEWPKDGAIEFKDVVLQYASCDSPVLRNVSFTCNGGQKVGIVGRTGAGKSSLVVALFRTVEPQSGRICIDGIDVLGIPLYTLRTNLAIVPQEPILFKGSIKSNLDPFGLCTDEEIWIVLQKVQMATHIASMPGETLAAKLISERGSNLSQGQRQLLCLARAVLRKAKILILDESTASVDNETDDKIQKAIRNNIFNCTVITIAHRLHTIAFYDQVIVMDRGRVAEKGTPLQLLQDSKSIFHSMSKSSGDHEKLLKLATAC